MRTTTASLALRISSNTPGSASSKKILSTGIMRDDERPTIRPCSVAMNGSTFPGSAAMHAKLKTNLQKKENDCAMHDRPAEHGGYNDSRRLRRRRQRIVSAKVERPCQERSE